MSNIKQELFKGVFWSAVEKYSGLVVSLIVSMVLARLLSPKEYGIVAIAGVFISFLQIFCTMGIGPAIIQRTDLTDKELDSIFTFTLSIGSILALLFFCSSWGIASFYDNQQLVPVCQIMSIQLLAASANMVPSALMTRDKRFKDIAKRTLTLQILTGSVSVIAALKGAGVYALLISPLLTAIGIFLWNRKYYKVRIDYSYDTKPIKKIFSFSFYELLFNIVNYFSRNLDKLIIGKSMNVDALGIYEKSYRLMQLPLQNITFVISPVMQPVLRDISHDKQELANKYAKIVRFIATLSFPIGIILYGMSYEVIHFFYGSKWDAAIPVFKILCLSVPLQMIFSTSGSMFRLCQDTKAQFWIGIRNTITTIIGFLIAVYFWNTIESIAWAWTITLCLNFVCSYYIMYKHVLHVSIIPFLKEFKNPTIIVIFLYLTLWLLNQHTYGEWLIVPILIKSTTSLLLTLALVQLLGQYNIIKTIKTKYLNEDNK